MGQAEEEELRWRQINPPERHPGWSHSLGRKWYRYGSLQIATASVIATSDFVGLRLRKCSHYLAYAMLFAGIRKVELRQVQAQHAQLNSHS